VRIVVQRVSRAEVRVAGAVVGAIGRGLLLFVAIEREDALADLDWFADKVLQMRIFEDGAGKMNLSSLEIGAEILVVSQFTLVADLSRGRRPGFERAAPPQEAAALFAAFVDRLSKSPLRVATGRFREFMEVELINDGPVTILLDGEGR
jgi:D-aminoacyl-tRNA deacylase